MDIIMILQIMIGVIVFIMFLLIIFYLYLIRPKKQKTEDTSGVIYSDTQIKKTEDKKPENYGRFQGNLTQDSIFDFMEFDEIVDDMIIRKNKTQYIMILQCNGVNYDLMSEQEKIAVEEGFVQFLNTLRFPIQLYVQSRTLNLKDTIEEYNERVKVVKNDIEKLDSEIIQAKRNGNRKQLEKLEFEKRRKQNVLSYGMDITDYVGRLNSNRNILQQRTYVVVSYFVSELGGNLENYSKDELDNMCFSELYTRCQNISSSLASSGIISKILDSEELAELLYVAYNRDESEIYQLTKALDAQYDALYSTGKDVLQKKQEKLDQEINVAAIDLATSSILKADRQKQVEDLEKERLKTERVKERANELLDTYESQLNPRVYELAKENVEKSPDKKEKEKEKVPVSVATTAKKTTKVAQRKSVSSTAGIRKAPVSSEKTENAVPKKKVIKRQMED